MLLKNRKLLRMLIPIGIIGSLICLPIGLTIVSSKAIEANKEGKERFVKNSLYQNIHSSISPEPILIKLKDFTYEETLEVKKSINEIDELSNNLNYIFEDNVDKSNRIIYINNNVELPQNIGGNTNYKTDDLKAEILYPIEINLRGGLINYVYSEDFSITLLSAVVTHEMMHTLGFSDLRTDDWLGKSIMYYNASISSDYGVAQMTDIDKKDIISVYGSDENEWGSCNLN